MLRYLWWIVAAHRVYVHLTSLSPQQEWWDLVTGLAHWNVSRCDVLQLKAAESEHGTPCSFSRVHG